MALTYTRATEAGLLGLHMTVIDVGPGACRYGPWLTYEALIGGSTSGGREVCEAVGENDTVALTVAVHEIVAVLWGVIELVADVVRDVVGVRVAVGSDVGEAVGC